MSSYSSSSCDGSSTSSVWGSADSHVDQDGHRVLTAMESTSDDRDSHITLDIVSKSGQSAQLMGSRGVVCKTHAEFKANKLNRNEQTKLETVKFRFVKEMQLTTRKFQQSEKFMRAKSAKFVDRIRNIESASVTEAGRSRMYAYERETSRLASSRSKRFPITKIVEEPVQQHKCEVCSKIQALITMYSPETAPNILANEGGNHSTCVFSDTQVRTFIEILQSKYFEDTPEYNSKDSGVNDRTASNSTAFTTSQQGRDSKVAKQSREGINNQLARRTIELRIREFCRQMDTYNTQEQIVSKEVQDDTERTRFENAILILPKGPTRHEQIVNEVRIMLKL